MFLLLAADRILVFVVSHVLVFVFFFQAEDGIRDIGVTGVQTCALPIGNTPALWVLPATSQGILPGLLANGENSLMRPRGYRPPGPSTPQEHPLRVCSRFAQDDNMNDQRSTRLIIDHSTKHFSAPHSAPQTSSDNPAPIAQSS